MVVDLPKVVVYICVFVGDLLMFVGDLCRVVGTRIILSHKIFFIILKNYKKL